MSHVLSKRGTQKTATSGREVKLMLVWGLTDRMVSQNRKRL